MVLNLDKKKDIIIKINKIAKKSLSAIIATIKEVSTNKITELRKISRIENVFLGVMKNTLLKIALKKTHLECLTNKISGPMIIGISLNNPGSAAKIFKKFSQENKGFKIITGAIENRILSQTEIQDLSNLPSYEEAIARFIITIKTATVGKLFSILLAIKNKNNQLNTTILNKNIQ